MNIEDGSETSDMELTSDEEGDGTEGRNEENPNGNFIDDSSEDFSFNNNRAVLQALFDLACPSTQAYI